MKSHYITKAAAEVQHEFDQNEREWQALKNASTDSLIDILVERQLDNDQWVTLMRLLGGKI